MSADVATLEGTPATLSDEALEGLQAQLRGTASANGDGAGREVFNAMHNPQPGLTVQASGRIFDKARKAAWMRVA